MRKGLVSEPVDLNASKRVGLRKGMNDSVVMVSVAGPLKVKYKNILQTLIPATT